MSQRASKCCICGVPAIHSLVVLQKVICVRCEEKLSLAHVGTEAYAEAVSAAKGIWGQFMPSPQWGGIGSSAPSRPSPGGIE